MAESEKQAEPYTPSAEEEKVISEVVAKRERWRTDRRTHEPQWFLNSAFLRGQQYVTYDEVQHKLQTPQAPSHRVRMKINRIRPKIKARLAKFLKNRPIPVVIPASTDREDRLNARATQKVLDYLWRKLGLEEKYKEALLWSTIASKGFWWFSWDPKRMQRIKIGDGEIKEAALGEVQVEVGNPFEILVGDTTIPRIKNQPEIMRVKLRSVSDVKARYEKYAEYITADVADSEVFTYEKQISTISPRGSGGNLDSHYRGESSGADFDRNKDHVLVTELFTAPTAKYPRGRYVVLVGSVLVKQQDELPYGFWRTNNPYPVVEFQDSATAGQFWYTTTVEQLIDPQREYNLMRSKISEQIKLMAHPKILVYKQHQLPEGAYTSEAGEIIEVVGLPGLPPPSILQPANIAPDAWKNVEMLKGEFDDLTHIYPSVEGKVGTAQSGFQTNLLQEAADSVHAPDIRDHELAIEEASYKIRRLAKLGYDIPRLITLAGRNYEPEVIEFSSDQIDEHADVVVQSGSALPTLKAARFQSVLELWNSGLMGDIKDPEVRRRAMSMLEMGGLEQGQEEDRRDEDQARLENAMIANDNLIPDAEFYENHQVHEIIHGDQLKSPEVLRWPPEKKLALINHLLTHADYLNPKEAAKLRREYGLPPSDKQMFLEFEAKQPQQQQLPLGQEAPGPPPLPPGPLGAAPGPVGPPQVPQIG